MLSEIKNLIGRRHSNTSEQEEGHAAGEVTECVQDGKSKSRSIDLPSNTKNEHSVPSIARGRIRNAVSYIISLTQSGIRKDYDLHNTELGKGKYGVVRPATRRKTGELVAVKVLPKVGESGKNEIVFALREIEIMQKLDHPNCIGYYGMYESSKHMYIVMELVEGGQLLERIIAKDHYSETEAARVFVQIISAIDYLHSKGVVHRDLKPENILYKTMDPESPIKVCDFGLGRFVEPAEIQSGRTRFWSRCGSPDYVAPEVLAKRGYGTECDVWSAGVVLYILLCGFPPFGQTSVMLKFDKIKKGQFSFPDEQWKGVSDDAKQLVSQMLCVDVHQRLTCRQALQHIWLKRLEDNALSKEGMPLMQQRLKEWNAARKLLAAIHTCAALNRMTQDVVFEMPSPDEAEDFLVALHSDPEREEELRESFRLLDRNGTGRVRAEDLRASARAVGQKPSDGQLRNMLDHFDLYHRGYIDFEEYCIMMAVYGQSALRQSSNLDISSGGGLSLSRSRSESLDQVSPATTEGEIFSPRSGFRPSRVESVILSDEEVQNAFAAMDLKHKGTITPVELQEVLARFGAPISLQEAKDMVAIAKSVRGEEDANIEEGCTVLDFCALIESHATGTGTSLHCFSPQASPALSPSVTRTGSVPTFL